MTIIKTVLPLFAALSLGATLAQEGSFYTSEHGLFSTRPNETKSLQTIARFGPVGMGIDLVEPAFVMKVHNIEEGSPAETSGGLAVGQIIESINGQSLAEIDPRIQLGQIIADAEAADGVIKFMVKDAPDASAKEVAVEIPAIGSYSDTWPRNCPKSDRIVRDLADHLASSEVNQVEGLGGMRMLFLLSTGEEKDLEVVRGWVGEMVAAQRVPTYSWHLGFAGVPLAEYYLRTGDESVLPLIEKYAASAAEHYYLGAWAGRGHGNFRYMGGGHLNAGGTHCATFVLLAKECGVEVEERVLQGTLRHFFRYAGRGINPYGDHRTERGYIDNGKNGILAFNMAAAASLSGKGEDSLFAGARDVSAVKSFYSTTFMLHGHTGGGIGEIWRASSMGLLYEDQPLKYREFMDNRKWHFDLSRRWDGSFGILGGAGYDDPNKWGTGFALAYTVPRETLRITGAPPSPYSKHYDIPARPWGTEADDAFYSLEPAQNPDGPTPAVDEEVLAEHSARPLIRLLDAEDVSEETLVAYLHHQDHGIRRHAACRLAGIKINYMGGTIGETVGNPGILIEALSSADPRVRRAAVDALGTAHRGKPLPGEIAEILLGMVGDPEESWWVVDAALLALGTADPEHILPHVDTLLGWLRHDDWWLQNAALTALTPVAADSRCYAQILPAIGELVASNQHANTLSPLGGILTKVQDADQAVQEMAAGLLGDAYVSFPDLQGRYSDGNLVKQGLNHNLDTVARSITTVPGGFDVLHEVAFERSPDQTLPHADLYLNADSSLFGPKLAEAIRPIILDRLVPEHLGKNRTRIFQLAAADPKAQSPFPGGAGEPIDTLLGLYQRAGVNDYDWHLFGPDLRDAEWDYHTFDPIPAEQVKWDQLISRYREVTLPEGMENWFTVDFDPAAAGWRRGRSAFGQYDGEIPQFDAHCSDPHCECRTPVLTLWDKEVLMFRGTVKLPPMTEGHRYRIRINDGNHVGEGGGYAIYINGRLLVEQPQCAGRGSGGKPKGGYITSDFLEDFQGDEVTIAVMSFLRYNDKYKLKPSSEIPQGRISLHFEEMLLPPLGPEEIARSAAALPMRSMAWQEVQDPDDREREPEDDLFRWDGNFVPNPGILGEWQIVSRVSTMEEFDHEKPANPGHTHLKELTLNDGGATGGVFWIWSGDTLMDLTRNEALKMTPQTIGGNDYLFIESGGFNVKHAAGWRPTLYVMARKQ